MSNASMAARMPAQPAPTTSTSCWASTKRKLSDRSYRRTKWPSQSAHSGAAQPSICPLAGGSSGSLIETRGLPGFNTVRVDLRRTCSACGTPAPPIAKYCAECGARIATALPATETRKLVTILFCDLVGSTALGESLDPEAFRKVQLRYFEMCERVLHAHGGTIEKFIGDAVLCVFGTPVAREDDALRGCRAALGLVA